MEVMLLKEHGWRAQGICTVNWHLYGGGCTRHRINAHSFHLSASVLARPMPSLISSRFEPCAGGRELSTTWWREAASFCSFCVGGHRVLCGGWMRRLQPQNMGTGVQGGGGSL